LVAFVILYSKLIGWETEGREHAAARVDQAFLVVVAGKVYELLICELTLFAL
jgi:hypothetical protein